MECPNENFGMGMGRTVVMWVLDDWSIIKDLDLHVFVEKIKTDLEDMGCRCFFVSFRAVIDDDDIPEDLFHVLSRSPFTTETLPKGNKHARVHEITVKILHWALCNISTTSNLFILSDNMKEDKQFASFVQALNEKDNYNIVFLPDPRSLLVDCAEGSQATSITCECCDRPLKKNPASITCEGCDRPMMKNPASNPCECCNSPMKKNPACECCDRPAKFGVRELIRLRHGAAGHPKPGPGFGPARKPTTSSSSYRSSSRVNDPFWTNIYAKANTGVFWDVVDFPIPESDPDLVSKQIRADLEDAACYNGPVSIRLYGDERSNLPTKQDLIDKYEAAGISISFVPEVAEAHGYARDHKMLVDILWWALESPEQSNLIILSKNMNEKATVRSIQALSFRGVNVLLAEPSEEIHITESSAWLWDSLCRSLSLDERRD